MKKSRFRIIFSILLIIILTVAFDFHLVNVEANQEDQVAIKILSGTVLEEKLMVPSENIVSNKIEDNSTIMENQHIKDLTRISEHLTIWYSPEGNLPTMFNQTENLVDDFYIQKKYETEPVSALEITSNLVCVLIESAIYDGIEASIQQFIIDVEATGFSIEIYMGSWGTPENIRTFLYTQISYGIVGAILIGDIPSAWYEMDHPPDSDWPLHEEFPTDLYYMDLNGIWSDVDADGLFDDHY